MTYSEALAWLFSTQHHGIKLGLENIRRLLEELGVEGRCQRVIHVAGTNGKGSVCAMLDAICRAQNYRTGLYTSPHLVEFRERIRIDGAMIDEESVVLGLTQIRGIVSDWEPGPTFFEIVTALALAYFEKGFSATTGNVRSHRPAEIVILETGLGGRLDATNAITPAVAVLTPIDFDHQVYLGDTLAAIAGEKAGIVKPGVPVVSASQPEEAAEVFREAARTQNAPIEFVQKALKWGGQTLYPSPLTCEIGLVGEHQLQNAALALKALEAAGIAVSEEAVRAGLRDVQWPGRFQRIQRQGIDMILDGAHNEAAASQLAKTWKSVFGAQKATVILGILRDKDVNAICRALAPIAERFIATPVRSGRSCTTGEVLSAIRLADSGIRVDPAVDFPAALAQASDSPRMIVTGSLFLVGEALALFEGNQTRPSLQ